MSRTWVELPVAALAGVVEREQAGTLHPVLRAEPMWLPREERHAARSALDAELTGAGLLDRRGRLEPDFRDWLPVLTNASIEYYGWLFQGETTWSVLAAARGLLGVLAVRRDGLVSLLPVAHRGLAETFAQRLPDVGPGGGAHWSVSLSDFDEVVRGRTPVDRTAAAAAREILRVIERPVLGGGELYVAERDDSGGYRRSRRPLRYVDTDWGRYLNHRTGTGEWFHVVPATPAVLASMLDTLRSDITVA